MRDIHLIAKAAIAMACMLLVTDAASAANNTQTAPAPSEKCYGIAKAGMNDCQTAKASCAGSATQDRQADAFLFVPKGLCNRIVGGNLQPITADTNNT